MSSLEERVVQEFTHIVQIDSLSLREEQMILYLQKRFKPLGVEMELQEYVHEESGEKSGNLIVRIPGKAEKRSLFFDAHLDTVEPGISIKPIVNDQVIHTDGSTILGADDKAGVAAMIIAAEEIINSKMEHGDVFFVFTSAEEIGLVGVRHLDFSRIKADFGYVLDSHGAVGGVIIEAPYHYQYDIQVFGKAAHAGIQPENGVSSIVAAAKIICELPQGRINPDSVANVGLVAGGKATNIVPDFCQIRGEFRSLNLSHIDTLKTKVYDTVEKYKPQAENVVLEINEAYKGFAFDENSEIIQFTDRALNELGIKPRHEKTGGGSNTNIYNQNGISALTLSCGMMNVHSTNEYIAIRDLVDTVRLILKLVELA